MQYTWKFNKAIAFTMAMEGGTNPDLLDRGGFTNHGISSKQYPDLDIGGLTIDDAVAIYFKDYWQANKCEAFTSPLSCVLFDTSVNCGQKSAALWMQTAVSTMGSEISIDGIVGAETILETRAMNDRAVLEGIVARRLERYVNLINHYPEQARFIKGWINRVSAMLKYVRSDKTP